MARPLKRFILPSDNHEFVGRIYDLSIVGLHFDTYDELAKHPDCKYAFRVNHFLSTLTRRVESLNMVGDMLWSENFPDNFKNFPLSRYEWLTVSADAFLMRFISVVDCVMLLINEVFECELDARDCTAARLKKAGVPKPFLDLLYEMIADQGTLRQERNGRFHHGAERGFSSDDQMFKMGSLFEHRHNGIMGENGQPLPVNRYFREGLTELQREFNAMMRKLVRRLDELYDMLAPVFEATFSPRFRAGPFGPNGGRA
ncbi:MAG: hypothetical protein EPO08_09825 [Rhodospirillaceae bacterium]|nr:MAG: hypothetical protein EPO08_09825 [Rhodospirillaceae bacterium]